MIDVIGNIMDLAIMDNKFLLAAWWYKVGMFYEIAGAEFDSLVMIADSRIQKMRKTAAENRLMNEEVYGFENINEYYIATLDSAPENIKSFLTWWYFIPER